MTAFGSQFDAPCDVLLIMVDPRVAAAITVALGRLEPHLVICPYVDIHQKHSGSISPALCIVDGNLLNELSAVSISGNSTVTIVLAGDMAPPDLKALAEGHFNAVILTPVTADAIAAAAYAWLAAVTKPGPDRRAAESTSATLSARERAVLGRLAAGETNAQIARELGLSLETVKTHLKRIYRALGAHDRGHAVALAVLTGDLDLYDSVHAPRRR